MAKKIVKRANIKPWKNFFNSLRATAETDLMDADLMDEHGLRRACHWAGNSAGTAMKNYALVKKTDFTDSGTQSDHENEDSNGPSLEPIPDQKSDAKSDAMNDFDAKSDAELSATIFARIRRNPSKKRIAPKQERGAMRFSGRYWT